MTIEVGGELGTELGDVVQNVHNSKSMSLGKSKWCTFKLNVLNNEPASFYAGHVDFMVGRLLNYSS